MDTLELGIMNPLKERQRKVFAFRAFLAFAVVLLAVTAYQARSRPNPSRTDGPASMEGAFSGEGCVATGLRIDSHSKGNQRSCLEIDVVRLRRKKMGVFRLGFWKEAVFENARLEIHLPQAQEPVSGTDEPFALQTPAAQPHSRASEENALDLREILLEEENQKALFLSGVKGLEIQSFHLTVLRAGRSVTSLRCDRARLDPKEKAMKLDGRVVVEAADGRSLSTSRLVWDLENNRVTVPGEYGGRMGGESFQGRGFETDLFLSTFSNRSGDHGTT